MFDHGYLHVFSHHDGGPWNVSSSSFAREPKPNRLHRQRINLYKPSQSVNHVSLMEDTEQQGWCCSGSRVPRAEIVYLCQIVLILSIVFASIYNLTQQLGDQQLWTALLSSCMGYLLPNPTIKS